MNSKRTSIVLLAALATLLGTAPSARAQSWHPPVPEEKRPNDAPTPAQDADSMDSARNAEAERKDSASDEGARPAANATTTGNTATKNAANIDQRKLAQFADALIAVEEIQSKANEDLQANTDAAAAKAVKAKAETDVISAVQRTGMQMEEFNRMSEVLASDVEFRSRVAAEVQKRRGG